MRVSHVPVDTHGGQRFKAQKDTCINSGGRRETIILFLFAKSKKRRERGRFLLLMQKLELMHLGSFTNSPRNLL